MGKLLYFGGGAQFFDNAGDPLAGGTVEFYLSGTSTPTDAYTESSLGTPHSNPLTLDAYGKPPGGQIWLNGNTKVVVKDSTGATITAMGGDSLNPDASGFGNWSTKNAGVITKSANYTVASGDDGKTLIDTAGTWTLSLLAAATATNGFTLPTMNVGSGIMMADGNASETINGSSVLAVGPRQNAVLTCDGSNWRAQVSHASLLSSSKLAPHSNLRVVRGTTAQITATADYLVAEDTNGNQCVIKTVSVTMDVSTTDENGRNATENGAAEAASTWYHAWVVVKTDGTVYGFLTSGGYPGGTSIYTLLPTGAAYAAYVGAVYNNSGSNLVDFVQSGNDVSSTLTAALSAGSSAAVASINTLLQTAVPQTARRCGGYVLVAGTGAGGGANIYSDSAGTLGRTAFGGDVGAGVNRNGSFDAQILTAQTLWYASVASANITINVTRWGY